MRLLNFYTSGGEVHLGVVQGENVFDLTAAAGEGPEFRSLSDWLRAGKPARHRTDELLGNGSASGYPLTALATLRHAPLVSRDSHIFCVGLNYADHAAENNLPPPSSPIFFAKLSSVVIPHGTAIPLPAASDQIDYEAEMAVVLGMEADCVSEAEAEECIAGCTIMNDVSARDLQRSDKQWFRGKNCNGFGPLGPWLVTADEVPDIGDLEITLKLNGRVRQHSNTRQLVFPPAALISRLSQTLKLEPGDVISTGTPAGIGSKQTPPSFLKEGDQIQIEISGIGTLQNTVGKRREV